MISIAEIRRSLTGAWQVLMGAPDAMSYFDTTIDGFWRSFRAIFVIAPMYVVISAVEFRAAQASLAPGETIDGTFYAFEQALSLALDWIALPLILAALAGFLAIRQTYAPFIVVRNWATVLILIPFTAISLLDSLGVLPGEAIIFPSIIAIVLAFRTLYMAARIALQARADVAAGIVVLDFLVSLSIVMIVGRLFMLGQ